MRDEDELPVHWSGGITLLYPSRLEYCSQPGYRLTISPSVTKGEVKSEYQTEVHSDIQTLNAFGHCRQEGHSPAGGSWR